jgi:hypothetical protein
MRSICGMVTLLLVLAGCGVAVTPADLAAPNPPADSVAAPLLAAATAPEPLSYDVGAGPDWSTATAYSCLEACALLFGGTPAGWSCSTSATAPNNYAWYSRFGSAENCGPTGTPLPEGFNPGGSYQVAGVSAYVNDWCFAGQGSINYCFALPPAGPPAPGAGPAGTGRRPRHDHHDASVGEREDAPRGRARPARRDDDEPESPHH